MRHSKLSWRRGLPWWHTLAVRCRLHAGLSHNLGAEWRRFRRTQCQLSLSWHMHPCWLRHENFRWHILHGKRCQLSLMPRHPKRSWHIPRRFMRQENFAWHILRRFVCHENFAWHILRRFVCQENFAWRILLRFMRQENFAWHIHRRLMRHENFTWHILRRFVRQESFSWHIPRLRMCQERFVRRVHHRRARHAGRTGRQERFRARQQTRSDLRAACSQYALRERKPPSAVRTRIFTSSMSDQFSM